MSGQAEAVRLADIFRVSIRSLKSRAIAVVRNHDGSLSGPAEYFLKAERRYLLWIDAAMPRIDALLRQAPLDITLFEPDLPLRSRGNSGRGNWQIEAQKDDHHVRVIFTCRAPVPEAVRADLEQGLEQIMKDTALAASHSGAPPSS